MVNSSVDVSPSELQGRGPSIEVHSAGHAIHVFVNGQLAGILLNLQSLAKIKLSQARPFIPLFLKRITKPHLKFLDPNSRISFWG